MKPMSVPIRPVVIALCCALLGWATVAAAFDPDNGDWGKSDPKHVRIMAWNLLDGIGIGVDTTPAGPSSFGSQYDYIGRICQAMNPDILCFEEVEPSSNLAATQSAVEGWVTTYFGAGAFNVYVCTITDGFNRNVTLSKFPFVDLNGDGVATSSTWFTIVEGPGGLPPGGSPGIRGWNQTEIDLPDNIYAGDLFVGCNHLKAGGTSDDRQQRLEAAQNIAYWINEALNKSQSTGGDPGDLIPFAQPPNPLGALTPVVLCGDFNEDEETNGRDGPVKWLADWTNAANDGTDRDESTMDRTEAVEPLDGSTSTYGTGSSSLDYIIVQDSIATIVHKFIFKSAPASAHGVLPSQLQGIFFPAAASQNASDHYPVIADLALPLLPPAPGDCDGDGDVDGADYDQCFEPCLLGPGGGAAGNCPDVDFDEDGDVTLADYRQFQSLIE